MDTQYYINTTIYNSHATIFANQHIYTSTTFNKLNYPYHKGNFDISLTKGYIAKGFRKASVTSRYEWDIYWNSLRPILFRFNSK